MLRWLAFLGAPWHNEKMLFFRFSFLCFLSQFLVCFYGLQVPVFAALKVTPVSPYQALNGIVNYSSTGSSSTILDDGFTDFNLTKDPIDESGTARPNILLFDVTSDDLTDTDLFVQIRAAVKNNNSDTRPIELTTIGGIDCSSSTNCTFARVNIGGVATDLNNHAAFYTAKSTLRIGIYPLKMCQSTFAQQVIAEGCNSTTATVITPSSSNLTSFILTFVVGKGTKNEGINLSPSSPNQFQTLTLSFQSTTPTLSCPSLNEVYFPGDSEIVFSADKFSHTTPTAGSSIKTVFFVAKKGGDPTGLTSRDFLTSNDIVSRLSIDSGAQKIGGFTNTTNGSDNTYNAVFTVRDNAGVIAPFQSSCKLQGVQTSAIPGFLNKSNCFIATAAFGDAEASPVRLLRKFRDQFLLKFEVGKVLVNNYYRYSPGAATWLEQHPGFRIPVLFALIPFQVIAWIFLHPMMLIFLMGAGGGVMHFYGFCKKYSKL